MRPSRSCMLRAAPRTDRSISSNSAPSNVPPWPSKLPPWPRTCSVGSRYSTMPFRLTLRFSASISAASAVSKRWPMRIRTLPVRLASPARPSSPWSLVMSMRGSAGSDWRSSSRRGSSADGNSHSSSSATAPEAASTQAAAAGASRRERSEVRSDGFIATIIIATPPRIRLSEAPLVRTPPRRPPARPAAPLARARPRLAELRPRASLRRRELSPLLPRSARRRDRDRDGRATAEGGRRAVPAHRRDARCDRRQCTAHPRTQCVRGLPAADGPRVHDLPRGARPPGSRRCPLRGRDRSAGADPGAWRPSSARSCPPTTRSCCVSR